MNAKNQDRIISIISWVMYYVTYLMPNRLNCWVMGNVYDIEAKIFPSRFLTQEEWEDLWYNPELEDERTYLRESIPSQFGGDIPAGTKGSFTGKSIDCGAMGTLYWVYFDSGEHQAVNIDVLGFE